MPESDSSLRSLYSRSNTLDEIESPWVRGAIGGVSAWIAFTLAYFVGPHLVGDSFVAWTVLGGVLTFVFIVFMGHLVRTFGTDNQ